MSTLPSLDFIINGKNKYSTEQVNAAIVLQKTREGCVGLVARHVKKITKALGKVKAV